jgi:hypothetical protein
MQAFVAVAMAASILAPARVLAARASNPLFLHEFRSTDCPALPDSSPVSSSLAVFGTITKTSDVTCVGTRNGIVSSTATPATSGAIAYSTVNSTTLISKLDQTDEFSIEIWLKHTTTSESKRMQIFTFSDVAKAVGVTAACDQSFNNFELTRKGTNYTVLVNEGMIDCVSTCLLSHDVMHHSICIYMHFIKSLSSQLYLHSRVDRLPLIETQHCIGL